PGVPDLYQGADYWDFSLVDPDNRRPVDFAARRASFDPDAPSAELLAAWHDGRIKQWLIARTLNLRLARPQLFAGGRYQPLTVEGAQAEHLLAFAREADGDWLVVLVPRLSSALLDGSPLPRIAAERWGDTRVVLPEALDGRPLQRLFSSTAVTFQRAGLSVAQVLDELSVEVLHTTGWSSGESEQ
ncbi:MAG TPA: malto-oligosyltrehalose synthase, partial [Telluria sp.]